MSILNDLHFELKMLGVDINIEELKLRCSNTLDLSGLEISILPMKSIININPSILNLSNNKIEVISIFLLISLTNLKLLNLENNLLSFFPNTAGYKIKIESLNLANNRLSILNSFEGLLNLKTLKINNNLFN